MTLEERFNQGIQSHTFRRIGPEYKTNIYVGFNDHGNMSITIIEPGTIKDVKPSREIDVQLNKRKDGKLALSFDLLDETYVSLFLIFCKDLINTCENDNDPISTALLRWKYWKNLFQNRNSEILSKSEIKGLIAELLFLRDNMIKEYGEEMAIKSWMGPLQGHKDFEINDTWYEIKAITEAASQVTINSIEQLESDRIGHLSIYRLEDTNETVTGTINLNRVVASVVEEINDPDNLSLLKNKLNSVGYNYNPLYESINFFNQGQEMYVVDEEFPSIKRSMIDSSIATVKYSIILEAITCFKEN